MEPQISPIKEWAIQLNYYACVKIESLFTSKLCNHENSWLNVEGEVSHLIQTCKVGWSKLVISLFLPSSSSMNYFILQNFSPLFTPLYLQILYLYWKKYKGLLSYKRKTHFYIFVYRILKGYKEGLKKKKGFQMLIFEGFLIAQKGFSVSLSPSQFLEVWICLCMVRRKNENIASDWTFGVKMGGLQIPLSFSFQMMR